MRWQDQRRSDNVEDRRGRSAVGTGVRVGGGAMLIIVVLTLLTGGDPVEVLTRMAGEGGGAAAPPGGDPAAGPGGAGDAAPGAAPDPHAEFVRVVLGGTEDVWDAVFKSEGATYQRPKLVLFSDAVNSACGFSEAAVGPFYCPGDQQVYIDLAFFRELDQRFGAPGDFAQAYVIAHEVGHHVQHLLGISDKVGQAQQRASREEANELSVKLELQADCFAGVYANHTQREKQILEEGDVEEGLAAAAAVGDDRLQRAAGRGVRPESWTHGSSAMRTRWFKIGFSSGAVAQCDTFNARQL